MIGRTNFEFGRSVIRFKTKKMSFLRFSEFLNTLSRTVMGYVFCCWFIFLMVSLETNHLRMYCRPFLAKFSDWYKCSWSIQHSLPIVNRTLL